jgi:hypothetical protein
MNRQIELYGLLEIEKSIEKRQAPHEAASIVGKGGKERPSVRLKTNYVMS